MTISEKRLHELHCEDGAGTVDKTVLYAKHCHFSATDLLVQEPKSVATLENTFALPK